MGQGSQASTAETIYASAKEAVLKDERKRRVTFDYSTDAELLSIF